MPVRWSALLGGMGGIKVGTGTKIQPLADDIEQLVVEEKLEVVTTRKMLRAEGKQPLGMPQIECGGGTMRAEVPRPGWNRRV